MSKLLLHLHGIIPLSRRMEKPFHLTADNLISCLQDAGLHPALIPIPHFEKQEWDDTTLAGIIFKDHHAFHQGPILIHTPACSRHNLPDFQCHSVALPDFIHHYTIEMLFDGDVLFLAPETRTLTIYHHEGAYGHVRCPGAQAR